MICDTKGVIPYVANVSYCPLLEFHSKGRNHWSNHPLDHQAQDLVSEFDVSSSPLSELEEDIVACIENLKEDWKAHDDIEKLQSGIHISNLVCEILPCHQGKVDKDFLSVLFLWITFASLMVQIFSFAIENLLDMGVLRTTIDENHLDTTDYSSRLQ